MRLNKIVTPSPVLNDRLCLLANSESFHGKTLISKLAVEAFGCPILPWPARIDARHVEVVLRRTAQQCSRHKYGGIVSTKCLRCAGTRPVTSQRDMPTISSHAYHFFAAIALGNSISRAHSASTFFSVAFTYSNCRSLQTS